MLNYFKNFYSDLSKSIILKHVWINLALMEIKSSYRRTKIGPLWITLSTVILLISIGPLYALIFKVDFKSYFIYLACGFTFWAFIKDTTMDNANQFVHSKGYILSEPYPLSLYIYKSLAKNIIIFGHNMVVVLVAVIFFSDSIMFLNYFYFFLGFILNCLILFFVGLIVSTICIRFRDVSNIIQNIFTVFFFITPIFWKPNFIDGKFALTHSNPFFSMIEIMRAPLLNENFPKLSFIIAIAILIFSIILSGIIFGKYKNRIALWS